MDMVFVRGGRALASNLLQNAESPCEEDHSAELTDASLTNPPPRCGSRRLTRMAALWARRAGAELCFGDAEASMRRMVRSRKVSRPYAFPGAGVVACFAVAAGMALAGHGSAVASPGTASAASVRCGTVGGEVPMYGVTATRVRCRVARRTARRWLSCVFLTDGARTAASAARCRASGAG